MVSESRSGRPFLGFGASAEPLTRRPERLHALTAPELAVAFSQGLDLGEGKAAGHAQRVCYIAAMLGNALSVDPADRAGLYFGALLHDIGVPLAGSDICRIAGIDEEALFGQSPLKSPQDLQSSLSVADLSAVIEAAHQHCLFGAETTRALDLPDEVAAAVRAHHERWDGGGYPDGAAGERIPIAARAVAVADVVESLIGSEPSSLSARRRLPSGIQEFTGTALDPTVVGRLLELAQSDDFWLGLYSEDMTETLIALRPPDARKSRRRVMRFAEVFADLADAKGGHTAGHSRKTAESAERLAEASGLDSGHVEMIRIAALLHDLGLLGVPARIMTKPDILSVTEMQLMRQHPSHAETVLQGLTGFEEVALWIARHHERPDGKGYPEMVTGDEIPLEARILSVADVFAALTTERPHRAAITRKDAKQIMLGAAGTQLDAELVRLFCSTL